TSPQLAEMNTRLALLGALDCALERRQGLEDGAPVALVDEPSIQDHDLTTVVFVAQESAQVLDEHSSGIRHADLVEWTTALTLQPLTVRRQNRVGGHGEGQLRDDHGRA